MGLKKRKNFEIYVGHTEILWTITKQQEGEKDMAILQLLSAAVRI